jgi:hypothetical protein
VAWSTPLTAVTGNALTAAQWNTSVRDNLNETAPAKFTAAHQYLVATGANAGAARVIGSDFISASETKTGTTWGGLSTAGPIVTVTTGTSALVFLFAFLRNNTVGESMNMGYQVTGATPTIDAIDNQAIQFISGISQQAVRTSGVFYQQALTSGSNTFTAQYRTNAGGTGNAADRRMVIQPF